MARASPRMAVTPRAGWSMASSTSLPWRVSRRGALRRFASFSIHRGCWIRTSVISSKVARGSVSSGTKTRGLLMAGRFLVALMSVVEALLLLRLVVGLPRLADLLRLRLRRHRHVPPREAGDRGP